MTRPLRVLLATLLVAPGTACDHAAPFGAGSYGSNRPFREGSPRRLTYNLGSERAPAWLPDESGIIYSLQRTDRRDGDWCLGVLPPDGGRLVGMICTTRVSADDSTDLLTEPAVDQAGRLALLAGSSPIGDIGSTLPALVLSSLADPLTTRVLAPFPDGSADTLPHQSASHVRWLSSSVLVYVAERVAYRRACRGCPLDTLRTGVAIDRLDLSGPVPVVGMLNGTGYASSVASGETSDVIYYTLAGDSRVFRRALSTGSDSVVFDFGGAGIARDVQVTGSRLVAVVGGDVSFGLDPVLGYAMQRDLGGPLHLVDLTSGADVVLPASALEFGRPALSPSGRRLVAEATDLTGSKDLWEFDLP